MNIEHIHFMSIGFTPDAKVKTCIDAFKSMHKISNTKISDRTFIADLQ